MYEVSTKLYFSAAHHLRGYAGTCANPHGHNWEVEIFVRGRALDRTGFVVDFRELKAAARRALDSMDHRDLNVLPAFARENPTSERLARHIFLALSGELDSPRCRVHRVSVCETPGNAASYWEDTARPIRAARAPRRRK